MVEGIKIKAEDATVRTTEVSIRCLVIGKKQMTLSVFRQIPSSPILDSGGSLRGKLWGRVNYFWKGCDLHKYGSGSGPEHAHIVWQLDGRLLRDCVRSRDFTKLGYRGGDMTLEKAAFDLLLIKRVLDEPYPEHPEWDNGIILKVQGLEMGFTPADFRMCDHVNTLKLHDWREGTPSFARDREVLESVSQKMDIRVVEGRLVSAYRSVSRSKKDVDAFNRAAARAKMEIEALDQLFIAV